MKRLSVLGSTGSIGKNTLEIVRKFPEKFKLCALCAKHNVSLLAKQIREFDPELAVVYSQKDAERLEEELGSKRGIRIEYGDEGYIEAAALDRADMVVTAVVGAAGLKPTLAAISAGKDIALANKETLVMAGSIVMERAEKQGIAVIPVDSEHSAIFQCLEGHRKSHLDKILLTASGGPFFNLPAARFEKITPDDALNHPTWRMGKKISIDSATLMNKGLEVIEARWLFDVACEQIQVVVHPQSIVHSMVAYRDGSILAQLGIPDMKGAIAHALSYPERLDLRQELPDFAAIGGLTFAEPDLEKFPCLALAIEACTEGGTAPAVLNAANEIAVEAFLEHGLAFVEIAEVIKKVIRRHKVVNMPSLEEILAADQWARNESRNLIHKAGEHH